VLIEQPAASRRFQMSEYTEVKAAAWSPVFKKSRRLMVFPRRVAARTQDTDGHSNYPARICTDGSTSSVW